MQKEHAEYVSDFSNKCFDSFHPDVEVKFEFNYGSKFDGAKIEFHFTHEEAMTVLDLIRMNLSENKMIEIKTRLESAKEDYEDNVAARDWQSCDYFGNCVDLYKYLLPDDDN